MVRVLTMAVLLVAVHCTGQIRIDSTRTTMTIQEQQGGQKRTLSVYRSYVKGKGMRDQAVYQPTTDEVGYEPETLHLDFTEEAKHMKRLLDIAMAKRTLKLSRFAFNITLYTDLTEKLVEVYTNSTTWKAYLQKAGNLKVTVMLDDGSQYSEIAYDAEVATAVLDSSDFVTALRNLFAPYGYNVAHGGFPTDHQDAVTTDKLMLMGRNGNLVIPVPNPYFNLEKLK